MRLGIMLPLPARMPPCLRSLLLGGKVLQQFLDSFADILFFLLRLCFGVQGFGGNSPPDELFRGRIVHAQVQLTNIDSRCRAVRSAGVHPATISVPSSTPARAVVPARVVGSKLFLSPDSRLISNIEVRGFAFSFRHPFRGKFGINRSHYPLARKLIRLVSTLDSHPLIRFVFRKIFVLVIVIANIL